MATNFITNFTPPGSDGSYKLRAGALFYGVTSNSTTAMTASIPGITEYYTGLTVILKLGAKPAAAGCTININSLGAKAFKYSNSLTGAYFQANAAYLFVYDGTNFLAIHSYDSDTNTWQQNTVGQNGYVTAPTAANANKVWKTDASGNPDWRDDLTGDAATEVIDNLTSTATNKALSANQGKQLKSLIDGKLGTNDTAASAAKLMPAVGSKGSTTNPVYFSNGIPEATDYTFTTAKPTSQSTNSTIPTSKAVYDLLVEQLGDVTSALVFKGTLGTAGSVLALPANHSVGWTYVVATAGSYAGEKCEVGDMLICITAGTAANNNHWAKIQRNIDGAVISTDNVTLEKSLIVNNQDEDNYLWLDDTSAFDVSWGDGIAIAAGNDLHLAVGEAGASSDTHDIIMHFTGNGKLKNTTGEYIYKNTTGAVGNSTTPIYIDANGAAHECNIAPITIIRHT